MLQACRPFARLAAAVSQQSAIAASHARISTSSGLSSGAEQVGPAEAAKEQAAQAADTDYNAAPQYPNRESPDAGEAAMAASRAPHPSGPMDTSSVNDPAGCTEGSYQEQQTQGGGSNSANRGNSAHAMHVHHPGREADVAALSNSSSGGGQGAPDESSAPDNDSVRLSDTQQAFTAGSGGSGAVERGGSGSDSGSGSGSGGGVTARIDQPGSGDSGEGMEGPGDLNSGVETTNTVAGSERAMTADFAAGGDDVDPPAQQLHDSTPVNPTSGLPQMQGSEGAGSGSGRFGELQNPGDVGEEGMTARQTEKSTGMDPGGLGSS